MHVEVDKHSGISRHTVEGYTVEKLLHSSGYDLTAKVCLESQPRVVAAAMGRLMDLLMDKGLMTPKEYLDVLECHDRNVEVKSGSLWDNDG